MDNIMLLEKSYDAESLYDLGRDLAEAVDESFTPAMASIPKDEHGFQRGRFVVRIEWHDTE